MDRKKRKRNRLSDGVARLYRQESSDELFPEPPTARPSAPARPSEDPTAQFTGYSVPSRRSAGGSAAMTGATAERIGAV